MSIDITVIVDDNIVDNKLRKVHGLSIYIELAKNIILFDTGPSPEILQYNSEVLGIDLSLLDLIVISHGHSDHVGGIQYVGWVSPGTKTYVPYALGTHIVNSIRRHGLSPVEVIDWIDIDEEIHISKPFYGPPWEHVLVIKSEKGLIIFTGCSHAGVNNIVNEVVNHYKNKIYAVVGGLHLSNAPDEVVKKTIDNLMSKIDILVPLHCSGKKTIEYAIKKYSNRVFYAGAGSTLSL